MVWSSPIPGGDALECVLEQDFAVIVLDIHMPEMDGFETASVIRSRERSQSTPIIFLTADDRGGARVLEGYRLGAVDYLYKPFDADILRAKVAIFVELFRKSLALEIRTAELTQVTAALVQREQQVVALNTELEKRVVERTAALADHEALLEAAVGDLKAEVAERTRTEETLRESEARFRKQYKGVPLPTYTWRRVDDGDFVLEDYNDAAEAAVGVGIRDWLGIRASACYVAAPDILIDLHACLAEQHTIRRELHHSYPDTQRKRDLVFSYVFVPPLTVMVHTEDVTEASRPSNSARRWRNRRSCARWARWRAASPTTSISR